MMDILPLLLLPALREGESKESKPLAIHPLLGKPVFHHAMKVLEAAAGPCIAVLGEDDAESVQPLYACGRQFARSFGEAVAAFDADGGLVLAVRGDMPCLQADTLKFLLNEVRDGAKAAFLQWQGEDLEQEPGLRVGGTAYCFDLKSLREILDGKEEDGLQYTPLEALSVMAEQGVKITPVAADGEELISVVTRLDYANAFSCLKDRINDWHMSRGVTLLEPGLTYIDTDVSIGADTVIYPGCHLQQGTQVGLRCTLLPNCRLSGAVLADDVTVESSVLIDCRVGAGTTVGPFAYLRPDSVVGAQCRIGDFVEIKNSNIGDGTKISHLTYVGDGDLGKNINLGCGVVFTNYDGRKKHRSTIKDNAFVGCNVNLVAPVTVGEEAYVAAGSTVTEDVPDGALYVARARGAIKEGWVQKRKEDGKL